MIFSCDKYDSIQGKAFNYINEVDNINFQFQTSFPNVLKSSQYIFTVLGESLWIKEANKKKRERN